MNRPYIRLSAALSLDGKLHHQLSPHFSFSSEKDRERLYNLRRAHQAILIGSGTLAVDKGPKTGGSGKRVAKKQLNIVVSSTLQSLDFSSPFFHSSKTEKIVATTELAKPHLLRRAADFAEVLLLESDNGGVDLHKLMLELGNRDIHSLLLEGGGKVNNAMLNLGLIDELYLTVCPIALGGTENASLFHGPPLPPQNLRKFHLLSIKKQQSELYLVYRDSHHKEPLVEQQSLPPFHLW